MPLSVIQQTYKIMMQELLQKHPNKIQVLPLYFSWYHYKSLPNIDSFFKINGNSCRYSYCATLCKQFLLYHRIIIESSNQKNCYSTYFEKCCCVLKFWIMTIKSNCILNLFETINRKISFQIFLHTCKTPCLTKNWQCLKTYISTDTVCHSEWPRNILHFHSRFQVILYIP